MMDGETKRKTNSTLTFYLLLIIFLFIALVISSGIAWISSKNARDSANTTSNLMSTVIALTNQVFNQSALLQGEMSARSTAEAIAEEKQANAQRYKSISLASQLAAEAIDVFDQHPQLGLLLAVEAVTSASALDGDIPLDAEEALRRILANTGGRVLLGHENPIQDLALSPDEYWLASTSREGPAFLWDLLASDPSTSRFPLSCGDAHPLHVAFSPDGKWLITAAEKELACLWKIDENVLPSDPLLLDGFHGKILTIRFSQDSHWLLIGSSELNVQIWDLANITSSGELLFSSPDFKATAMDISEDLTLIAFTERDNQIYLLDIENPEAKLEENECPQSSIWQVAISPDNSWVAAAGDKMICMINLDDRSVSSFTLKGHEDNIRDIVISKDSHWLVSSSGDNTARLWNLKDPDTPAIILSEHQKPILDMAFTSDHRTLITASGDSTIRVWDLESPDPSNKPKLLLGHEDPVYAIAISEDGQWLASGGYDGFIRLWNFKSPFTDPYVLPVQRTHSLAISHDSQWLMTAPDNTVQIWDLNQPIAFPLELRGHTDHILSAEFFPDSQSLVTGSWDETVRLWDLTSPDPNASQLVIHADRGVTLVALSPDGRWLLYNVGDRSITYLWDRNQVGSEPIRLEGLNTDLTSAAFSPDEHWLVTGGTHGAVLLWDLTDDETYRDPMSIAELRLSIITLEFSSNNHFLIGAERDTILLWDFSKVAGVSEPIILRGHEEMLRDIAISTDNQWIAAASVYGVISLWEINELNVPFAKMNHPAVNVVTFSPDGRWLASGGQDSLIRLWDMHAEDPTQFPIVLEGHEEMIYDLSFTPDGRKLISAGPDSVRIWNIQIDELLEIACSIAGRNLTLEEWRQYFGSESYRRTCPDFPEAVPTSYEPTPTATPIFTPTPTATPTFTPTPIFGHVPLDHWFSIVFCSAQSFRFSSLCSYTQ